MAFHILRAKSLHPPNLHTLPTNITGYSAWHSPTSCAIRWEPCQLRV